MLDQSAEIINGIRLVFLHLEIACWLQTGITGLIRLYWQVGIWFLLSLIGDGGDELYDLYAQACEERKITSVLDLKHRILPQDEYEAKWPNWCDGFNQAATLLLKKKADAIDKVNR